MVDSFLKKEEVVERGTHLKLTQSGSSLEYLLKIVGTFAVTIFSCFWGVRTYAALGHSVTPKTSHQSGTRSILICGKKESM